VGTLGTELSVDESDVFQARTDHFDSHRPQALVALMLVAVLVLQLFSLVQAALPAEQHPVGNHCESPMSTAHQPLGSDCRMEQPHEAACCDSLQADCADHCAQGSALVLSSPMVLLRPAEVHRSTCLLQPPDAPVFSRYQPPRPAY